MVRPSIDQLESFVTAARLLNFRAAAKVVGLSPAAFGQRIQALEDLMEVRLFRRTTRSVALTVAGLRLLPEAKACLAAVDSCARVLAEDDLPPVELTLGTRFELGVSWMVPALTHLEKAHPNVKLNLYFGASDDLIARLRGHAIDCMLSSVRLADASLSAESLHPEHYVFVGQRRLLDRTPFTRPAQASRHCLIDIDATLPLFRYFADAAGGAHRFAFGRQRWVGLGAAMERLILDGHGVGVLPRYMVAGALERGTLVPLFPRTRIGADEFRLVFRRDDPRAAVHRALAETLRALPLR
ncbi:MAG: LysR family transcriptional regulator [Myxococcota bacterium]